MVIKDGDQDLFAVFTATYIKMINKIQQPTLYISITGK